MFGNASLFGTNGGTRYWRFRNVNFFTDDSGGATYPVTNATWSGGIATLTLSGSPSISPGYAVAVNGITPAGYNFGNTANVYPYALFGATANTISYLIPNDPGPYSGGGTVQLLFQYSLSAFINWGAGFDANVMPDHLEVIQCAFHGDGDGDVSHGIMINGDNVRIVDSYFTGLQNTCTDAGVFVTEYGSGLEIRNNYIGGGDENYGVGGSHVAAGTIPRFEYFLGNSFLKEPWQGMMAGSGDPGSLPCFTGKWFHNNTSNIDFVCSGSTSTTSGTWSAQANLLTKSQRAPKNLWECKICQGIRMIGNDFGLVMGQTAQGPSVVLNLVSQPFSDPACPGGIPWPCTVAQNWNTIADVNVQANKFHDSFSPFGPGYSDTTKTCASINPSTGLPWAQPCYNYGHHNVRFTHNVITNISDERSYCPAFGSGPGGYCVVSVDASETQQGSAGPAVFGAAMYDFDVSNNTMTSSKFSSNSGLSYGVGSSGDGTNDMSGMFHVRDNIIPIGARGWAGQALNPADGCGMEAMFLVHGGGLDLHNNILTNDPPAGHIWHSFNTGSVTPACATAGIGSAVWPSDHVGGMSWTSILDTSTFKVRTGGTACNGGPCAGYGSNKRDPGADVDLVNWRTAHAIDGAPAPNLDYAIQSLVPNGTGLTIYATAPDLSGCTWELSTDPNLYVGSVPPSSQARSGRSVVATWVSNSLTANTLYYARATCSGLKLETMANGTRAMVMTGATTNLAIVSYDMFNGNAHHEKSLDAAYTGGTGDPTLPHAALAGGHGYLTDGILGGDNPYLVYPLDQYKIIAASWTPPGNCGTPPCPGTTTYTLDRSTDLSRLDITGIFGQYIDVWGNTPPNYDNSLMPVATASGNTITVNQVYLDPGTWIPTGTPTLNRVLNQNAQMPNWVLWAMNDAFGEPVDTTDSFATVTFKLASPSALHGISIYTANVWSDAIKCFDTATVDFSSDGATFSSAITYNATAGDKADRTAHWVNIPFTGLSGTWQYVRVHMTHEGGYAGYVAARSNWIPVSEVQIH